MSYDEILDVLKRRPFVPLRVHASNGQTVDIKHPEMAMLAPSSLQIALDDPTGEGLVNEVLILSLRHVMRVEEAPQPSAPMP